MDQSSRRIFLAQQPEMQDSEREMWKWIFPWETKKCQQRIYIFKNKHFQQIFRQQTNVEKYRNENTPNFYNTGLYWYVDVRIMDIIVS